MCKIVFEEEFFGFFSTNESYKVHFILMLCKNCEIAWPPYSTTDVNIDVHIAAIPSSIASMQAI